MYYKNISPARTSSWTQSKLIRILAFLTIFFKPNIHVKTRQIPISIILLFTFTTCSYKLQFDSEEKPFLFLRETRFARQLRGTRATDQTHKQAVIVEGLMKPSSPFNRARSNFQGGNLNEPFVWLAR